MVLEYDTRRRQTVVPAPHNDVAVFASDEKCVVRIVWTIKSSKEKFLNNIAGDTTCDGVFYSIGPGDVHHVQESLGTFVHTI